MVRETITTNTGTSEIDYFLLRAVNEILQRLQASTVQGSTPVPGTGGGCWAATADLCAQGCRGAAQGRAGLSAHHFVKAEDI